MLPGQSIRAGLLDQNGHKFARIQYSPDWSPSKPYCAFYNGTAYNCHETLSDAKLYLLRLWGVPKFLGNAMKYQLENPPVLTRKQAIAGHYNPAHFSRQKPIEDALWHVNGARLRDGLRPLTLDEFKMMLRYPRDSEARATLTPES